MRFRSPTRAAATVVSVLLAVAAATLPALSASAQVPPPPAAGLGVSVPGRTRQPVFVATTAADGSFFRGSDAVTLTVDGPGASAIFADPFARSPVGTDTATLPAQEGFAVFYVAHDTPGPVSYVGSLAATPAEGDVRVGHHPPRPQPG